MNYTPGFPGSQLAGCRSWNFQRPLPGEPIPIWICVYIDLSLWLRVSHQAAIKGLAGTGVISRLEWDRFSSTPTHLAAGRTRVFPGRATDLGLQPSRALPRTGCCMAAYFSQSEDSDRQGQRALTAEAAFFGNLILEMAFYHSCCSLYQKPVYKCRPPSRGGDSVRL